MNPLLHELRANIMHLCRNCQSWHAESREPAAELTAKHLFDGQGSKSRNQGAMCNRPVFLVVEGGDEAVMNHVSHAHHGPNGILDELLPGQDFIDESIAGNDYDIGDAEFQAVDWSCVWFSYSGKHYCKSSSAYHKSQRAHSDF